MAGISPIRSGRGIRDCRWLSARAGVRRSTRRRRHGTEFGRYFQSRTPSTLFNNCWENSQRHLVARHNRRHASDQVVAATQPKADILTVTMLQPDDETAQVFGERLPGRVYVERPGAY